MRDERKVPPPDPAVIARLDREWPQLRRRLLGIAYKICKSLPHAKTLVTDAYYVIRIGRRRWNLEKHPDLATYAGGVIGSLWANQQAGWKRVEDIPIEWVAGHIPNPEQLLIMKEEELEYYKLRSALDAEFKPGDRAHAFLALTQDHVYDPEAQAELLGLNAQEIKNLRARVRAAIDRVCARNKENKKS